MAIESNDPKLRAMVISLALARSIATALPEKRQQYAMGLALCAQTLGWEPQALDDIVMLAESTMGHDELVVEFKKAQAEYNGQELSKVIH